MLPRSPASALPRRMASDTSPQAASGSGTSANRGRRRACSCAFSAAHDMAACSGSAQATQKELR